MAIPAPRSLMTAEGLFELPDDGYRYELVDGYLVRMTPAGGEHGVVTARVGKIAEYFAAGTRLVWIPCTSVGPFVSPSRSSRTCTM